jgi:hypothetical protein
MLGKGWPPPSRELLPFGQERRTRQKLGSFEGCQAYSSASAVFFFSRERERVHD